MEELDLDKLPRRMPYSVPEGTFDAIKKAVLASIARERETSVVPPDAVPARRMRAAPPSPEDISLAFEKLSPSDQAFILSVYEDEAYTTN